jgi:hypothetical protein
MSSGARLVMGKRTSVPPDVTMPVHTTRTAHTAARVPRWYQLHRSRIIPQRHDACRQPRSRPLEITDDHERRRVIDDLVDDDRLAVLGCLDAAALYYKSGGYPWRLPRREDDLATCFLGVSFFQTLDGESLWSSIAQVFNQRGVGMVIRAVFGVCFGGSVAGRVRRPAAGRDAGETGSG